MAPASRRGFLRGLTTLPLIGGGVTLIGNPSAAAVPVTDELLNAYDTFLFYERCRLNAQRLGASRYWQGTEYELAELQRAMSYVRLDNPATGFHANEGFAAVGAGGRAALVLSAVGCDWREGGRCA